MKSFVITRLLALCLALIAPLSAHANTVIAVPDWQLAIGDYDPILGGRYGLIVEMPGMHWGGELFEVVLADLGDRTAPVAHWITAMPGRDYSFTPIAYLGTDVNFQYLTSVGVGEPNLSGGSKASQCWPDCLPDGFTFPGTSLTITRLDASSPIPEPGTSAMAAVGLLALLLKRRATRHTRQAVPC